MFYVKYPTKETFHFVLLFVVDIFSVPKLFKGIGVMSIKVYTLKKLWHRRHFFLKWKVSFVG